MIDVNRIIQLFSHRLSSPSTVSKSRTRSPLGSLRRRDDRAVYRSDREYDSSVALKIRLFPVKLQKNMPPASSKKRTASTFANDVGGPPSKKVIVSEKDLSSKSKSKAKAKGKAKDVEPKAKTRRKPITAPESDGTDSDEDEGGGEEMMGELDDDEYPAETGPDDMDVDSAPQVVKDPNGMPSMYAHLIP
jgi:hypothetical protein